ncbi:ATP12 family chaperone protein [Chelatococcus asaccharovorans]|uniref:ATP12 family chaperone protein n=1 Tax=Chelatococcus asaccharovorans TaxID=28210 RepID=UPI00224C6AC4|nr:ATP12 family protein [Chelatococcus asaccharovorans]CAH1666735.1 Chaperone required for assembly of F1-ATPase [Chelatococcus asaccharovorans]CAH1681360.1 Chaperone required for assembly of F1-ATPase [Chelatococcus asaccharovorans]
MPSESPTPSLPKRFYTLAGVETRPDGFALVLDGRGARTPGRRPLVLPTQVLAEAVAAEWEAQEGVIDPRRMPLTRLANSAIDGVADNGEAVAAEVIRYAGSDLLCYRADHPEKLVTRQAALWDPVLAWAREELGARFILAAGVMHVTQPDAALEAVAARVERYSAPFSLAALNVMTTLTGSVLLALAVAEGHLSPAEAWAAAHVDEDFQIAAWGEDEEASARRAARWHDFAAAARLFALSRA